MAATTVALEGLDEITGWQEELYRFLHAHPELSFQEVETRAEIARRLREAGYEVQEIGGGVVGVLRNGAGPTVLFRADIDALPVTEATGSTTPRPSRPWTRPGPPSGSCTRAGTTTTSSRRSVRRPF